MKPIQIPAISEREKLVQTPTEKLVDLVLRQQAILQLDRRDVVRPAESSGCGGTTFSETPTKAREYQVAELAEQAIEVVLYEQQCCECGACSGVIFPQKSSALKV